MSPSLQPNALGLADLIKEGREFLAWATTVGAKAGSNNWLEKSIVKMEKILGAPSEAEAQRLFDQLYADPVVSQNNLSDMQHLRFIRNNVGVQDVKLLSRKLTEILRGPDSVREEQSKKTRPRDVRFELSICARHNSLGIPTVLADPNPDLFSTWGKQKIAIEAKRVFSGERIEERLTEAHRQLRDRPASTNADMRVIYCDITRSFTSGTSHIQGRRDAVFRDLDRLLVDERANVHELLAKRRAVEIDAVILWYQDYFEPGEEIYAIVGLTQALGIVNPVQPVGRRRNAERLLMELSPGGHVTVVNKSA
ncbi:hypothetical protein [Amycolatopsis sp. CB00013]|uniref:hypothetical protein n=1 Tax=Amycolatopsis sp. CB00013 TaxID=1703945 RepID=UPI0011613EC2|nr:hypothetical protein [Amycolatopsis sp. CB00013]